ncbi:hypothetical protein VTP01DRAFT_9447 [Rhizomucor pusillus]|uniref:uncharacterized protein n=1 Tax=Rhizomucor pusillus TaxID=4840 RepID=UPI003742053A
METDLNNTLDSISSREGVKGVVLADENGLCIGTRGIGKSEAAAFVSSIAITARDLLEPAAEAQGRSQYPTITVQYEHSKVIIRNEGAFTLAIFM